MVACFSVIIGLSIGNFLYQLVTKQDYNKAFETSYFQAMACLIYGILI